ncbi:unnamed protein product, partial [Mesorhabditis belari]|uniref:Uncharacterized protein n=1 Tax=Mesorhabditis belari TaxID=2138241 RepID=A0AAF3JA68_9BILA
MDEEIKPMASLETAPPPLNTEEPLGEGVEGLRDEQEMEEELLNPPQSSDAQEKEQQAQMASEEKAKLEQIVFNQTQELDQLRLQMKSISSRNQELTNQIANSTAEIASKDNKYRLMETSRDDTAFKKIQSDEVAEKYKREKEERDTLVRSITREKNMLNEEIVSVKERLKNVNTEKMELVAEKKAWDREKRENQCELQRVRDEIAVLRESKKWLLSEINERDNKVSQLRIDASNKEIVWQNEKNNFSTKADFLNERIVELEAELKNAEATAAEQTKEFRKALDVQEKRVFEADYELTLREKITQDYKDALNEAEGVIAELKANCQRYESSIGELHEDMKNLREVVQKKEEDYENELKERSTQIAELQDELEKANELLKSRYSVGAATDEELQKIAPAAAAASQLIRSGMTLSQLYREYARVIGELEEQKVLNLQLDNEMSTIVEEIEKNAPNWKRQKEQLDRSLTHNDHLTEQLEKAADERMSLLQQKDSALRELSFTKMELERFQREHTKLREQTTHLLFVIESEARTSNGGPPLGADEQRRMYTSITGLQQKNIQLQMELENVQRDSQKRVEDAVRIESVRLREELETSKKEHENLQVAMNHLKTVMASLEQQRDRLRDLVEKGSLDPEAAQLRKENEDMKLELTSIKARYQLLENRLKELQEASTTQQRYEKQPQNRTEK